MADLYIPTEEDIAFFQTNGYWLSPKLFDDDELACLREHHARVIAGEYETKRPPLSRNPEMREVASLVQVNNAYWTDGTIGRLVLDERLGAIAAHLAGVNGVRLWHDQLLLKLPQSDAQSNIGWHQDQGYWLSTDTKSAITAWVAFDDVDEENGCMEVVPQSHTWNLLGEQHFRFKNLEEQEKRIAEKSGRPFESVPCILPAGCVSFHHSYTIHGSRANTSDRPRISIAVHMIPDGTRFVGGTEGEGHTSNILLQPKDGDFYAGPYFPVIYRKDDPLANVWKAGETHT